MTHLFISFLFLIFRRKFWTHYLIKVVTVDNVIKIEDQGSLVCALIININIYFLFCIVLNENWSPFKQVLETVNTLQSMLTDSFPSLNGSGPNFQGQYARQFFLYFHSFIQCNLFIFKPSPLLADHLTSFLEVKVYFRKGHHHGFRLISQVQLAIVRIVLSC